MRRPASTVLLALLAACTVTTTGAPCGSDLECPSDQGCGSDGRCGAAALACPGHTTAGQCRPGTSCSPGGQLLTCTAEGGVCSSGPVASDCPVHQSCQGSGGAASCACAPTRCGPATTSFCGAGGVVVSCAQETGGAACYYEGAPAPCADPGAACVEAGGSAACACPTANACATAGATRCDGGGTGIESCQPAASGSACLTWQAATDCAAGGLTCSAGACACPSNPGPTFVADAVSGSPAGAAPGPTGLDAPASCRFRTLGDALVAAGARGPGSTVLARGWSASIPGGTAVYREAGAIQVGPGIALATDDATPDPTHYAVTTAAALTGAFVAVGPGASIAGLEIRNEASSGPGLETRCPAASDTAPVTLTSVAIAGSTTGAPVLRFSSGLRLGGSCPAAIADARVSGAVAGVLVEAEAPASLAGGAVSGNETGLSIGASGAAAPALTAAGTAFRSNSGDAISIVRGAFTCEACPFEGNGTHVHAQPAGGAAVSVTVRDSRGAARMTGAANSALRLLALGSGSTLVLSGLEVVGNAASQDYNVASGPRRGGGMVLTPPLPGASSIRASTFAGNAFDQILVASSTGSLDLSGGISCETRPENQPNSFACYDPVSGGVGVYSNGAAVAASWNRWTQQPGAMGTDVGGTGVSGFDTSACQPAAVTCP